MAFAMILAWSCQKTVTSGEKVPESEKYSRTLAVGVEADSETRVGFDDAGGFYWHKGDRVGVQTSAGLREMVLDDACQGLSSGVFSGDFEEAMGEIVVYPYGSHVIEGEYLAYYLPSSYVYASIDEGANSFNPPMYGRMTDGVVTLKHLASFIKISVNNIPAGGDDMKFVLTADKRITGVFDVDLSASVPVILTDDGEGNIVTIDFSNAVSGAKGVFYVPVPLGEYGEMTAEIKDGEKSLAVKTWTNLTVSRKTPKRGTMDVDYVAEINGSIYKGLQEALDGADGQVVNVVQNLVLDAPVTLPSGKTVVLDLNGNTISATCSSAAASNLFSVKKGADLTIKNGTIVFAATNPDTQWGGEGQPPYPGYANNTIRNEGVLTIENAHLENRTMRGGASYVIDNYNSAKLTVNDGSVITQSGGDVAIRMFNGSAGEIDVTINGGTITGYRAVWIQLASNNPAVAPTMKLTVTGGTLNSVDEAYRHAVYSYSYGNDMKNVFINVSGGTFNGAIALTGGANKTNLETVNITGGTFNGPLGDVYSYGADEKAAVAIAISGGTFSEDPSPYLAEGCTAVLTDGKWSVAQSE
jgi:hypothetical protein